MILKRSIAYTSNWFHTLLLSIILAILIVFILVFLQPFDTYGAEMSNKNLKLLGYSICVIQPILFIHVFEEFWFKFSSKKWYVYQELIILFFGVLLISISSYLYSTKIINNLEVEPKHIMEWSISFGLPFVPIFIPLWAYLRFKFSIIIIKPIFFQNKNEIIIIGNNQNEEIKFLEEKFIMAKAQANYVDVYYLKDELLEKRMIRSTLSNIIKKIPSAEQIHRSYIVNPSQIKKISGNTRKGNVTLNHINENIPISPKHFLGVKNHLQNRP